MLLRNGSRGLVIFLCVMAAPVSAFAQQPKEIQITATEFSFKPSKIQVPQGEVKKIKKKSPANPGVNRKDTKPTKPQFVFSPKTPSHHRAVR